MFFFDHKDQADKKPNSSQKVKTNALQEMIFFAKIWQSEKKLKQDAKVKSENHDYFDQTPRCSLDLISISERFNYSRINQLNSANTNQVSQSLRSSEQSQSFVDQNSKIPGIQNSHSNCHLALIENKKNSEFFKSESPEFESKKSEEDDCQTPEVYQNNEPKKFFQSLKIKLNQILSNQLSQGQDSFSRPSASPRNSSDYTPRISLSKNEAYRK
jgi:hypothetical protein